MITIIAQWVVFLEFNIYLKTRVKNKKIYILKRQTQDECCRIQIQPNFKVITYITLAIDPGF